MIALANRAEGGVRGTMMLRAKLTAAGKFSVKIACVPAGAQGGYAG